MGYRGAGWVNAHTEALEQHAWGYKEGPYSHLEHEHDAGAGLDALDALLDDVVAVLVGHALDDLSLQLAHKRHLLLQAQHLRACAD